MMEATQPVDFCVAFNGMNADVLSKIFFDSLLEHCNVEGLRFHVIDNGGVKDKVNIPSELHNPTWHTLQKDWKPSKPPDEYYAESVLNPWTVAEWIVENCGNHRWCIISHFDIVFKGDIILWMRKSMSDNVGVIGTHCPIMAINRLAYKKRKVGFAPEVGHDVGIRLEQDLKKQGWRHVKFDGATGKLIYHLGAGASYHNETEFNHMRTRAINISRGEDGNAHMNAGITTLGGATVIHLTYKDGESWRIACMSGVTNFKTEAFHPNYLRSNDTRAVTCATCKKTKVFEEVQKTER